MGGREELRVWHGGVGDCTQHGRLSVSVIVAGVTGCQCICARVETAIAPPGFPGTGGRLAKKGHILVRSDAITKWNFPRPTPPFYWQQ